MSSLEVPIVASLRARKTKAGVTWQVLFRVAGKQLGESFLDERDALNFKHLVEEFDGATALRILAAQQSSTEDVHTVDSWLEEYLDPASGLLTGVTEGTRNDYRNMVEKSISPYLGKYPLSALSKQLIGSWVTWLENQPSSVRKGETIAPKTVKNRQRFLSSALEAARERGDIEDNPAKGAKISDGYERDPVFLTYEQFEAILDSINDHYKMLAKFLVGSGLRWSEATALTWADLKDSANPATIRVSKAWKRTTGGWVTGPPKSKKSRRSVSLWGTIASELAEGRGRPTDLIFTTPAGGRIYNANFRERVWLPAVQRAFERGMIAELPTLHDLRHTHASWLIEMGVPLTFIQARMGHESIKTTSDTYGHLQPDAHVQMAAAIGQMMGGNALVGDVDAVQGGLAQLSM